MPCLHCYAEKRRAALLKSLVLYISSSGPYIEIVNKHAYLVTVNSIGLIKLTMSVINSCDLNYKKTNQLQGQTVVPLLPSPLIYTYNTVWNLMAELIKFTLAKYIIYKLK